MPTLELSIDNMHCGACVRRVMQAINSTPGAHADEVQVGSARVSTTTSVQSLQEALSAAGFPAHLKTGSDTTADHARLGA